MGIKRCKSAFAMDGGRRVLNPGALVDENDPAVAASPGSFEDVETYVYDRTPEVEQATAAPGEKRARRSRKTETAATEPASEETQESEKTEESTGDEA